jgi:hypothetical protein
VTISVNHKLSVDHTFSVNHTLSVDHTISVNHTFSAVLPDLGVPQAQRSTPTTREPTGHAENASRSGAEDNEIP